MAAASVYVCIPVCARLFALDDSEKQWRKASEWCVCGKRSEELEIRVRRLMRKRDCVCGLAKGK